MDCFTIEIAGLVVRVQPLFMSTRIYCEGYLSSKEPDVVVTVTREDLVFQQKLLDEEALEEGLKRRVFKDTFLERATIQYQIAIELLKRDCVLLHGSTVGVDGNAFLFTAPCGTGKSTHTRFWRETFGDRAVMVNDDKTFLKIIDGKVFAYGSPWCGKHGLESNVCLPLKGICFLQRGNENVISSAVKEECLKEMIHQCTIPEEDGCRELAVSIIKRIADLTPLWQMRCTKDVEAAQVSYRAMGEEK